MISPSVTISRPRSDLEAHRRLAGNDLDDAHADRRERACEVLREVRDLRDLDARRGRSSKARDDGPGMHLDDFGLDAEIAQLQLDEARHRLERLGRVAARRGGGSSSSDSAGSARARLLEQRDLLFLFDAFALLDLGRRASIFGGLRSATFFCSSRTTSCAPASLPCRC
jgi:hypothetical protein